jgi:succinate dehydrogenase flavin-adding protein (antitoxin of CptAB toxin-antitoxin module)
MLELDLMLQGFFQQRIDRLNESELIAFDSLLRCPDDQLYDYLLGQLIPSDKEITHVVRAIRDTAKTNTASVVDS